MAASTIQNVKSAIEAADCNTLRELLAEDSASANQLIVWGKNGEIQTHPLHYISDMLFQGVLKPGNEISLVEALLEAGADPNYQATNGETPLLGAASLYAEDVGIRLIHAGALPNAKGIWEATPLHWASITGLDQLVAQLIQTGADLNLTDTQYGSPPIGWAIHGHFNPQPGRRKGNHAEIVRLLVLAGAHVKPEWLADEKILSDSAMLAALSSN